MLNMVMKQESETYKEKAELRFRPIVSGFSFLHLILVIMSSEYRCILFQST